MPISGATLVSGGTYAAPTGGTVKTFSEVGETIRNGKKVSDLSVADSRIRPTITCINRPATLNSLGKYISKDKRTVKIVQPKILTDGSLAFNVREVMMSDHPETTLAEKAILDGFVSQITGGDADFQAFIHDGSVA